MRHLLFFVFISLVALSLSEELKKEEKKEKPIENKQEKQQGKRGLLVDGNGAHGSAHTVAIPSHGLFQSNPAAVGFGTGQIVKAGHFADNSHSLKAALDTAIASGTAHDLGVTSVHTHKTITKEIAFPVPYRVPYVVEKTVPHLVPHPVPYAVDKPYPVPIPSPYIVPVDKPYAVPVDKPVPVHVRVPVHVPVPVHHDVHVHKPVAVPVDKPVAVPVLHHVPVHKPVPVVLHGHENHGYTSGHYGGGFTNHGFYGSSGGLDHTGVIFHGAH